MAENPKYKLIGQNYVLPECAGAAAAICAVNAAIGDDFLRRTPATPSMIVASLDAGKRVDEGLVTHV